MSKGINIPLTISGLREAREEVVRLNGEIEKLDKNTEDYTAESKRLNEALDQKTQSIKELESEIKSVTDKGNSLADTLANLKGVSGGIKDSFSGLKDSLFKLDFKGVKNGVKGLGSQFKVFGKILLANPIFLIVAIVAAIVIAIIKFKDKVKILSVAFEFFGKVIGMVIQHLKDMLDWLGLTEFAEQDQAEARKKRAQENLKNIETQSTALQSDFDRKIALANAEGKSTVELEIKKQKAIVETNKLRAQQLKQIAIQKELLGEFNDEAKEEFKKNYTEILQSTKDAQNQIKVIEAGTERERRERAKTRAEDKDRELEEEKRRIEEERKAREDADKARIEREDAQYKLLQELTSTDQENEIAALVEQYESKFALAEGNAELEKALTEQLKEDIAATNKKYADEKIAQDAAIFQNILDLQAKEKQEAIDAQQAKIAAVEDYATQSINALNSINNLANVVSENRLKKVQKGSKEEEKIRKRMFARQKALNLAMAAIDGFKAITASLAQAPIAIGPIPSPMGIASLAFAAASTAASIGAIAAQKYDGGGSKPSAPTPSLGGGGATSSAPSTPSFELFGQPNQDNNVSAPQSQETQQMTVKAVVVESDITSTQNKVAKMQKNAEL